jgi:geranylgeranyl pyrophosphate synthase
VGQRTMSLGHGVLAVQPHSLTCALVPGACLTAGADWHVALWPAAGAECMMAAADLFDDVADSDAGGEAVRDSGVVLTVAAGLLSLSAAAVVRVVEDGGSPTTAVCLARLLGTEFARAANGQAANLLPLTHVDAITAYRQAAAKSGPLGSLIARLGARAATDDPQIVGQLGEFGRRLAVRSQLLNDARDVAPDAAQAKADVRAGAATVPLAFVNSRGAPEGLSESELCTWEHHERDRIAAGGGLVAAQTLAEAERLGALAALDALAQLGCPVLGLRALID